MPGKRPEPRRGDLKPRLLSAVAMAGMAATTAWVGGFLFDQFWTFAAVAVFCEWIELVGSSRSEWLRWVGAALLWIATFLVWDGHPGWATFVVASGALASVMWATEGRRGLTAAGVVYAGVLAVAVPLLRHSDHDGLAAIVWLFAVVWGTDTMAYFGGRLIGGPKLAPRLSPKKTWSGFLVGVVSGSLLGLAVAPPSGCPACVLLAGLVGAVLAQAGDLFESFLKRRFDKKDAGSLIPGHGGLMDRLDGFIATTLFAAAVGLWRFGPSAAGSGLLKW